MHFGLGRNRESRIQSRAQSLLRGGGGTLSHWHAFPREARLGAHSQRKEAEAASGQPTRITREGETVTAA